MLRSLVGALALACASYGPTALGAVPPGRSAAGARALSADSLRVFEVEEIADGVFAALVVARPDAYAFANSLIVIGTEGVLVVDTQQSTRAAQELIRLVRRLSPLPVQWVVNTHWHGDHVYGNVAYRDAFPGVRFLAHPETVVGMREQGAAQRADELSTLPESIAERQLWLDEGSLPDGRALTPGQRDQVTYSLELRRNYFAMLRALEIVEPEGTIDARRSIDLGGRLVELIPLGPAHTEGDVGVLVPDASVLAVGDLLEMAPPWIDGAASLAGWADALNRVSREGASILLPSHGGVQRGGELLARESALFTELTDLAARAVSESWGPDRISEEMAMDSHRGFLEGLGLDEAGFLDWRTRAVAMALGQARALRR